MGRWVLPPHRATGCWRGRGTRRLKTGAFRDKFRICTDAPQNRHYGANPDLGQTRAMWTRTVRRAPSAQFTTTDKTASVSEYRRQGCIDEQLPASTGQMHMTARIRRVAGYCPAWNTTSGPFCCRHPASQVQSSRQNISAAAYAGTACCSRCGRMTTRRQRGANYTSRCPYYYSTQPRVRSRTTV